MQQKKVVSLWAGIAESDQALEDYLTFTFNVDGEAIPCPFGRDFQIDWFDEDFREASVKPFTGRSLPQLLAKHSDGPEITLAFVKLFGDKLEFDANAVVLLYEFKYDGTVLAVEHVPVSLRFIGAVNYD